MVKLRILYEQLLNEVGDLENIQPYPYSGDSFTTEQGWNVIVDFQKGDKENLEALKINTKQYSDPIYNVGFSIEGVESQFNKTSLSEYLKILKTVTQICKDFIKKNDPKGLIFLAANKDDSKFLTTDPQKSKLYKLIVMKQLLNNNEYKMVNLNPFSGFEGFMIYKK